MSDAARQAHWQSVYTIKSAAQTSWNRPHLDHSLRLIDSLHLAAAAPVLDVGGGRATLDAARQRMGAAGVQVRWLCADILEVDLPAAHYALWHDRAAFHFLIDAAARDAYVAHAAHAVRAGGRAIIATFAADGPERCSGLPVMRDAATALATCCAPHFECIADNREEHHTAAGATQPFTYVLLRRRGGTAIVTESASC
ncbi:class I SAM-dependent methyltransferase [Metallibacterium sp.]|uniref:class I SAM-dependent methyltransferase n=1 Tax=Metallibacterium sp. TaxID=2940281 RepID=UPI00260DAC82|nr:class I SAM-dependent methyltransferase [Metallibacterium sp.]